MTQETATQKRIQEKVNKVEKEIGEIKMELQEKEEEHELTDYAKQRIKEYEEGKMKSIPHKKAMKKLGLE